MVFDNVISHNIISYHIIEYNIFLYQNLLYSIISVQYITIKKLVTGSKSAPAVSKAPGLTHGGGVRTDQDIL